jgi:hypothetical protein
MGMVQSPGAGEGYGLPHPAVDYNGFLRGFYWIVSTERGVFETDIGKRVFPV